MVSGPIHAPGKSHQHPWGGNQNRSERFGKNKKSLLSLPRFEVGTSVVLAVS